MCFLVVMCIAEHGKSMRRNDMEYILRLHVNSIGRICFFNVESRGA